MTNFAINFTIPWLLLLLVPAFALTLLPYFKLNKRYRRTRNRIISIILHLAVSIMAISLLAGISFSYDIPNEENELILVVDMSYSSVEDLESDINRFTAKDAFVRDVLEASDGDFKVGVVAFGYKPVTVVAPSFDSEQVLVDYFTFRDNEDYALPEERLVDDSASDISAALDHAATLITSKTTSKIVLVSDGVETDGNALSTVKRLAAEGVKVDTVSFYKGINYDFEIVGVEIPKSNYIVGDIVEITLSVQSSITGKATITLYDSDEAENDINYEYKSYEVDLVEGLNELKVTYTFSQMGMHRLNFTIIGDVDNELQDTLHQNNSYNSYIYLEVFDKILILEGYEGEATVLKNVLVNELGSYDEQDITVVNINPDNGDFAKIPKTMDELRMYDQVILANVANADLIRSNPVADSPNYDPSAETEFMPVDFDDMLNDYVELYGGGVFMIGGNNADGSAHSFNRADIALDNAAALREILPIEVVNYTPPVAVMVVVDRSGSMGGVISNGKTALDYAKDAARACLDSLTYRDYMGVMSLENSYSIGTPIVSVNNRSALNTSIDALEFGGGTQFAPALERAGQALSALSNKVVSKRHVILITDGEPLDNAYTEDAENGMGWASIMASYNASEADITFSIMHIGNKNSSMMQEYFESDDIGGGSYIQVTTLEASNIATIMRQELQNNAIQEYDPNEVFTPAVEVLSSNVVRNVDINDIPTLTGYYGTKLKAAATTILSAAYVPLYAQWQFGNGKVGAFMSSLKGDTLSSAFLSSIEGQTIVSNIITGLMPAESIRPRDINVTLSEENYTTRVSVATNMKEGEHLRVIVTPLDRQYDPDLIEQVVEFSAADGYSRALVEIKDPGVHRLSVEKYAYNEDDEEVIVSSTTVYKSFSYSKEYDVFVDVEGAERFLDKLATSGRGEVVAANAGETVFDNFDKEIHKVFDPRMLFMILSIIFFLLDIAVRKFKFKWPHEIIRDYKERKKLEK